MSELQLNIIAIKLQSIKVRIKFFAKYLKHMRLDHNDFFKYFLGRASPKLHFLAEIKGSSNFNLLKIIDISNSQLFQDIFVINELNYMRNGFYVEFGAMNGISGSNTYILEKKFNWTGILCEPSVKYKNSLIENRPDNFIETSCIYSESDTKLLFNDTKADGLSTLDLFSTSDNWDRTIGEKYYVNSISLNDLLEKYNAPSKINYMSIDTEGSEYEILRKLNFDKYTFDVITVEHNFTPARKKIHDLLVSNGYKSKYTSVSSYDDWYVK